jgi:hypothetical protein
MFRIQIYLRRRMTMTMTMTKSSKKPETGLHQRKPPRRNATNDQQQPSQDEDEHPRPAIEEGVVQPIMIGDGASSRP